MNKEQAAEYLGVSPRTLERYTNQGLIGCRYEKGTTRKVPIYDDAELQRFKEKQEQPVHRPAVERMATGGDNTDSGDNDGGALSLFRDPAQAQALTGIMAAAIAQALASEQSRQSDRFLTLDDASEQSGISRSTLERFIKDNRLKVYKGLGRGRRVKLSELTRLIETIQE